MKHNMTEDVAAIIAAVRCAPFAALVVAAALGAGGQTPRTATVRPHVAGPAKARVRFAPELLTTVAGVAGSGSNAPNLYYNGIAANLAALPASINSLAFNSKGDLYLVSAYPASVFKINASDGTISTVLGAYRTCDGESCGPTTTVQVDLNNSKGVAVSPVASVLGAADDVFVADTGDHVIYKLDAQGTVSVVAGTLGQSGYSGDGGLATGSLLNAPTGMVFDASGNLYISDGGNSAIRRISATDGSITTVAGGRGSGLSGDGGPATQAQVGRPFALAFGPSGNLLFTDTAHFVVRKINMQPGDPQSGVITTVAGNTAGGYAGDGGPATSAELSNAEGLAVDAAGQIYIGDTSSQVVRRVALDGTISTIAGIDPYPNFPDFYQDGLPATQAYINSVAGLAFDANGTLHMSALGIARVLKLGPGGALNFGQQEVGTSATQTLTVVNEGSAAATFYNPAFVAQGAGFTALPSATQGCVQGGVLQPGGQCQISVTFSPTSAADYETTLGLNEDDGSQPSAGLKGTGVLPATTTTIGVSPQTAAAGNAVVLSATVVPASGTGATPTGTVQFVDNNTRTVLAQGNLDNYGVVSVQTTTLPTGYFYVVAQYGGSATYAPSMSSGADLEIDAKTAAIVLTSSAATATTGSSFTMSATIQASGGTPTGSVDFQIDGTTVGSGTIVNGAASATVTAPNPGVHRLQAVYRGDGTFAAAYSNLLPLTTHGAVLQFTPGSAVTLAGIPSDDLHGGFSGEGGPATSAYLHTPAGVTTDGAGNAYIADEQNNVIRKVALDGTITTVAGIPYAGSYYSMRFSGDGGPATSAYLDNPSATVVDTAGNLYIADYSNNVVRKVDAATGIIATVAGNHANSSGYNGDGTGTVASLSHPSALALDATGNLYIADTGNNLIRKLDTAGNLTTIAGSYYASHYGSIQSGVPATSVALYNPMGVAVDPVGNVYISDTTDNVIRKVDTSGTITTIGGGASYTAAAEKVPATSASLNLPQQIVLDLAGNIYFAEAGNAIVRKIDTSGVLTTPIGFVGSSSSPWSHFDPQGEPSTFFQLQSPSGVAVGLDGSLFATDTYNQTIIRSGTAGAALFGPSAIGTTSPAQSVTLSNVGDAALQFGGTPYRVTGDYAVSAGATQPCDFTQLMQPGAHCTISVKYVNSGGGLSGAVTFAANVAGTPTILLKTKTTAVPTTTSLYTPGATATAGDNLLFLATVDGQGPPVPGSVAFYDGATLIGSATISGGYAYVYVSTLAVGTHSITATYVSNGYYATSTSDAQSLVITGAGTSTTLAVSSTSLTPGSSLTMTATVMSGSSVPVTQGSVVFYDGSMALATRVVNANGMAMYTTTSLSTGTHSITAAYQQSNNFPGSTSSATTVTVGSGGGGGGGVFDYTVTVAELPTVIHRGDTGTVYLDYSLINNFGGSLVPTCGTLPSYATCSFNPSRVILNGAGADQPLTLTIAATPR